MLGDPLLYPHPPSPASLVPRWPGGEGRVRGPTSRFVTPPTSPSQPCGLGSSLSPLKGGEGLVSAGIILVERDASRAIELSSPDSLARGGGGCRAQRGGEGLSAAEDRFCLFFPCSIRPVGKRSRSD